MLCLFQRGAFVSEPAILVKRMGHGGQVWSMEKLENKLVDMRDMYEEERCRQQSDSELTGLETDAPQIVSDYIHIINLLDIRILFSDTLKTLQW